MAENAETPELDTSSGDSTDESMAAIAEMLSTAFAVVGGTIGNPCIRARGVGDRAITAHFWNDQLIGGVLFWATESQESVRGAIANWGRGYAGAGGGKAFGTYLINNYRIDGQEFPPMLAAVAMHIRENLPAGEGNAQIPSVNEGYRLGPGIYIRPGGGGIQGSVAARAYENWRTWMRNNVYSTWAGRTNWQARLVSWVGRSRSGWTVWEAGDPIDPVSKIGRNFTRIAELQREEREEQALCDLQAQTQAVVGQGGIATIQSQIAAELAGTEAEERTKRIQVAAVAIALLGGFILIGGQR